MPNEDDVKHLTPEELFGDGIKWGRDNKPIPGWFVGISDVSLQAARKVSPGFMADTLTPLKNQEYPYRGKTYNGHDFIRKLVVDSLKKHGIKREAIDGFNHLYDSKDVAKMLTVMTAAGVEMFLLVDEDGNGAIVDPVYLALARKGAITDKAIDFKNSLMLRLNKYIEQAFTGFVFPTRPAYSLCGAYAFAATATPNLESVQPVAFDAGAEDDRLDQLETEPVLPKSYLRGQFKDPKSPGENLIEVVRVLEEIEITDEKIRVNSERVVDEQGNTIYEY